MFALTAFYIGSSAFRAFRAMNMHATILLISGALVMLGRVPIGEYVSKSMPDIAQWIMDTVSYTHLDVYKRQAPYLHSFSHFIRMIADAT